MKRALQKGVIRLSKASKRPNKIRTEHGAFGEGWVHWQHHVSGGLETKDSPK